MNEFVKQQLESIFAKNKPKIVVLQEKSCVIKIVGIGGAGCNILRTLIDGEINCNTFVAADTDFQLLKGSSVFTAIYLGARTTKGLGTKSNPEKGYNAAKESLNRIEEALEGADVVILVAGLGGGTGTGATQIIADAARTLGAFTVGLVTMPFLYEGKSRMTIAEEGVCEIDKRVDSLIIFHNEQLIKLSMANQSLYDAFKPVDAFFIETVRGIIDQLPQKGIDRIVKTDVTKGKSDSIMQSEAALAKNSVLKQEADIRIKRDLQAAARDIATARGVRLPDDRRQRQPLRKDVKNNVWNRDGGRCVECGSKEKLEFDHIIPHSKGGSDTERNIQLLSLLSG